MLAPLFAQRNARASSTKQDSEAWRAAKRFQHRMKWAREMKSTTKKWFAVAALLCTSAVACGSPCDDLQEQCNACQDSTSKAACETVVKGDSGDACQAAIDSKQYEKDAALCKGLTSASVSVGAGGGSS